MKFHPYRMWRSVRLDSHGYVEVEISQTAGGAFSVWAFSFTPQHVKRREEYALEKTLREAKRRGEAMAVELLKHAAQALGVA